MSGSTREGIDKISNSGADKPSRIKRIALLPILAIALWTPIISIPLALSVATPCATEDSNWCHWNAHTQGNGSGTSFVVFADTLIPLPIP